MDNDIPILTEADLEAAKNELKGRSGETETESDASQEV